MHIVCRPISRIVAILFKIDNLTWPGADRRRSRHIYTKCRRKKRTPVQSTIIDFDQDESKESLKNEVQSWLKINEDTIVEAEETSIAFAFVDWDVALVIFDASNRKTLSMIDNCSRNRNISGSSNKHLLERIEEHVTKRQNNNKLNIARV